MKKNTGEVPVVSRSILPYQSIAELPPVAPEISKLVTVESPEKYLERIRNYTTYAGDTPYKNATIENAKVDPNDPELANKVFLIQNYAQQSKLTNMVEFAAWLRYLGVDIFNLQTKVDIRDESGSIITSIEPSLVEVDNDNNHKFVNGTHRFLTAGFMGATPNCTLIRNYDETSKNPYKPVPIADVNINESVPQDNRKRALLDGASYLNSINYSLLEDTNDALANETTFNNRFRNLQVTLPENISDEKRDKLKQAGAFLGKLKQKVDFLAGIITASELNPNYPEFIQFEDITDLGDKSIITSHMVWSGNIQDGRVFKILAEKTGVTKKYSSGFLIEPTDTDAINLINSTQQNPRENSTQVYSKETIIENKPYYDVVKVVDDNGEEHFYVNNRVHIKRPEVLPENMKITGQGSIFIVKVSDQPGNYWLTKGDYKAILGGTLHRGPQKCFGFVPERFETNLGVKLRPDHFKEVVTVGSDIRHNGDVSRNDIFFMEISSMDAGTHPTRDMVEGTYEFGGPEIVSAKDIYHDLRYGKIVDNASQAPLFMALARDGAIQLKEEGSDKLIVFSEIHDPINDVDQLILPDSVERVGRRIGGLGFADVGKSWISGMTTIAKSSQLGEFSDRRLTTLTVTEVFEGIKNGKFDIETTANLSRLFINGNLVTTNFEEIVLKNQI